MSTDRPCVEITPGIRFGQPHVKGVSAGIIAERYEAGDPIDVIVDDYDALTRGDVLVACWYAAMYGERRRVREMWRAWADQVYPLLAARDVDYDAIPDPPLGGGR